MSSSSPLDPVVVAQLGNLELRARRILDGLYTGQHAHRHAGASREFSEHRPYYPGDDPKTLDWKIYGRTDRLSIKRFEAETNFYGVVAVDDSASMGFSHGGRPSKLEYAKTLAAALGYLLVSQHDQIGHQGRAEYLAPRSQRGHLETYFRSLEALRPAGVWPVEAVGAALMKNLRRKGFLIVLTDLMTDVETVARILRTLRARKHEILVLQILDPAERSLPFEGAALFEDAETGERVDTDATAIRAAYREHVERTLASFANLFRRSDMDYGLLTTDLTFDRGLGRFLSWRASRL